MAGRCRCHQRIRVEFPDDLSSGRRQIPAAIVSPFTISASIGQNRRPIVLLRRANRIRKLSLVWHLRPNFRLALPFYAVTHHQVNPADQDRNQYRSIKTLIYHAFLINIQKEVAHGSQRLIRLYIEFPFQIFLLAFLGELYNDVSASTDICFKSTQNLPMGSDCDRGYTFYVG